MDKQPEALRLADSINSDLLMSKKSYDLISAELRRLHQANQELVEVAEMAAGIGLHTLPDRPKCGCSQCDMVNAARAALAKLKEKNNG